MSGDGKLSERIACEAFWAAVGAGPDGIHPDAAWAWAQSMGTARAWRAVVAAVETQQVRLAREDRDQLRKQVLGFAGELDGRCAVRPPGQSHTEHETAIELRKIAEPPS